MNPQQAKWKTSMILILASLFILVMPASVALVSAQETTAEPETTEAAVLETATEAASPNPVVEETSEVGESTQEAEVTPEPETSEEVVSEPSTSSEAFFEDFENFTSDKWLLNGWSLSLGNLETLVANADATILDYNLADFSLTAQVFVDEGNTALIAFRSNGSEYRAEFASNGSSRLYRDDVLLDAYAMQASEASWLNVSLLLAGDTIAISVNEVTGIVYTDSPALGAGAFAFRSGAGNLGKVMLDNLSISPVDAAAVVFPDEAAPISVTPAPEVTLAPELTPEAEVTAETTVEAEVTPETTVEAEITPEVTEVVEEVELSEAGLARFPSYLATVAEMIANNEFERARVELESSGYRFDNQDRLHIQIYPAEGVSSQALESFANSLGGRVDELNTRYIYAFIPMNKLINVLESDLVARVVRPTYARSTGPTYSPHAAPLGTVSTEGFDILGLNDWHLAGFMGAGVRVGIVDTGFALGDVDRTSGEFACLAEEPNPQDNVDHGWYVLSVICDLAPQAQVFPYSVSTASDLAAAVYEAMFDNIDVLVIAVDISDFASGDGAGLDNGTDDPYEALRLARESGMVVFAAAGNYGHSLTPDTIAVETEGLNAADTRAERYVSFQVTTTTPDIEVARVYVRATINDEILISWNDWAPEGLGASDEANLENFDFEFWQYDPNDPVLATQLIEPVDFDATPLRTSLFDDPRAANFILRKTSATEDCISYTPDNVAHNNQDTFESECYIAVRVFRRGGDSLDVVMQLAVNLRTAFVPRFIAPLDSLNGNYYEIPTSDVEIIGFETAGLANLLTQTGTIARPADSPDVIAVGAVCASEASNFALVPDSSMGPIFGENGTDPLAPSVVRQSNTKPEILSVAYVSTNFDFIANPGASESELCNGTFGGLDAAGGFGGTSAAAAHAAGMTAVMLSNPTFRNAYSRDAAGVQGIQDYIQSHSIDLPFGNQANGFDYTYGAGVFTLGSPLYNPANTQNVNNPPDLLDCSTGSILYVGQGYMDSENDGTLANPFTSIAYAANLAGSGDCIVVMPGEYVSPLLFNSDMNNLNLYAYENVSSLSYPQSIIHVNGQYSQGSLEYNGATTTVDLSRNGGIYLNGVSGVRLQGFSFTSSSNYIATSLPRQAIYALNTTGIIIEDNNFGSISLDGVSYLGFDETVITLEGGTSTRVEGNTFSGNSGSVNGEVVISPVISVLNVGTSTAEAALIRLNEITDNTATSGATASLILSLDSFTDIVANTIHANESSLLINAGGASENLRIVSNLFQNNSLASSAMIMSSNLTLSLVNNTIAGNVFTNANTGPLLAGNIGTPDFANNVVHGNEIHTLGTVTCGTVQNNYWQGYTADACIINGNGNVFTSIASQFVGAQFGLATSNTLYYALATSPSTGDGFAETVDYENYSGSTTIGTVTLGTAPFDRSVNDENRISDAQGADGVNDLDLGAFEYVSLSVSPLITSRLEDSGLIAFNLADSIEGGLGTLNFSIVGAPQNFSASCGAAYSDDGLDIGTGGFAQTIFYCAPRDFYTTGNTAPYPENVVITYSVSDQISVVPVNGTITLTIDPLPDMDLDLVDTSSTGFGEDDFVVVGNVGQQNIQVRLRPYVAFNNFRFSERGTPDFFDGTNYAADYPFTYTNPQDVLGGDSIFAGPPVIIPDDPTDNNAAYIQFSLNDVEGIDVLSYDVTDARGNSETFYIRVRSISRIPINPGIYDDSSFAFDYSPSGTWDAISDVNAINNTLHQTNDNGAVAGFGFRGTGFVLYMDGQGGLRGGNFQLDLYIDGAEDAISVTDWQALPDSTTVYQAIVTEDTVDAQKTVFFCTTDAIRLGVLSSTPADDYAITCSGFVFTDGDVGGTTDGVYDGETLSELSGTSTHLVDVVNLSTRTIAVDAFSILDGDDTPDSVEDVALSPGFHDVDSLVVRDAFGSDWVETRLSAYSNGLAYVLSDPAGVGGTTANNTVSFLINGGTGFAIQTSQEVQQVEYEVCVTDISPTAPPNNVTCQRFNYSTPLRLVTSYQVFRPFYGLDPDPAVTYRVEILPINIPANIKFVIDGVQVFEPTETATTFTGAVDDTEVEYFVFGGGVEDSWALNTAARGAFNNSLTSVSRTVRSAGPYIAFNVDSDVDTVYWTFSNLRPSTAAMVCVDRGQGVSASQATAHGNCIVVDLQTGVYSQVGADGDLIAPVEPQNRLNIQLTKTTIILDENDFRELWNDANSIHTFEIFSIYDTAITLDRVVAIGSDVALTAGRYEEYTQNIQYLDESFATATIGTTESPIVATYAGIGSDFVQVLGNGALRDFGGGVMYTTLTNSVVSFRFTGTGFAPAFRLANTAEEVNICWIEDSGSPTAADAINNGVCQRFDNEDRRLSYNALRPIFVPYGTYRVAIQFVGENFSPTTNRTLTPEMWFDGVVIYDTDFSSLNTLSLNTWAEGNFVQRHEFNQFAYFGDAWTSTSGSRARNYSASNVDSIPRGETGATVAFRVNGANALYYTRGLLNTYAPYLVCATNTADYTDRYCQTIDNSGRGNNNFITIYLTEDTDTTAPPIGEYVVTITSLNAGGVFFDAVMPIAATSPLSEGIYDDNEPRIIYNYGTENLVPNGNMEINGFWTNVGDPVNSTQTAGAGVFYNGRFAWAITTDGDGSGIQSHDFELVNGETYTFIARVRALALGTTIEFVTPCGNIASDPNRTSYQTLRCEYLAGDETVNVQIVSADASVSFYVDDVQVVKGAQWVAVSDRNAFGGYTMESRSHGAEIRFGINGTGFGLGMYSSNQSGALEVCYTPYTPASTSLPTVDFTGANCFTFENETARASNDVIRVVEGLASGTYAVRLRDVEDGDSVLRSPATIRNSRTQVSVVELDYIQVFNSSSPEITSSGLYSESANDNTGSRYLEFVPENRWGIITGRAASRYSDTSYASVLDSRLNASRSTAGGAAILYVNSGGAVNTRIVVDVQAASRANTSQVLACVDGMDGEIAYDYLSRSYSLANSTNCTLFESTLWTSPYLYLTPSNLPNLGIAGNHTVVLQSLTTGLFTIDDYQVLFDDTLEPGYYEEGLVESVSTLTGTGTFAIENNRLYSGGSAWVWSGVNSDPDPESAELSFDFTGTGISVVSALFTNGGNLEIDIVDQDPINPPVLPPANSGIESTDFGAIVYGNTYSIAGLPYGTYSVTITASHTGTGLPTSVEKVAIDAIEIYGTLQILGSLYDDAQTDETGVPYITYGPSNDSWQVRTGRLAPTALNQTLHFTQRAGAVASFRMNDARGIVIYHGTGVANPIEVCFREIGNESNVACVNPSIGTTAGNVDILVSQLTPPVAFAVDDFIVSITTTVPRGTFQLDAIQVLESGLHEGIFTASDIQNDVTTDADVDTVNEGNFNATTNTIELGNGDSLVLNMTGVAFSMVIENLLGTSQDYTVCVETIAGTPCDVLTETLPIAGDIVANGQTAISYAGLHDDNGNERTLTVRITNNANGILRIKALHILSNNPALNIGDTSRYENSDARIRYLPFGSFLDTATIRSNQSQGSEHIGRMQGSMVYFEITDLSGDLTAGFEYVRQLSGAMGSVEVCYGLIGDGGTTDNSQSARNGGLCATYSNVAPTISYQVAQAIETEGYCAASANGCWVTVRNTNGRSMAFDFVRLYDASAEMTAGYYDDSYPGLNYESGTTDGTTITWASSRVAFRGANDGFVSQVVADAFFNLPEEAPVMWFVMQGTGFSIDFALDAKSDAVEICYAPGTETNLAGVQSNVLDAGICQIFENEARGIKTDAQRTFAGLPTGTYTVAVRMLPDNLNPRQHLGLAGPVTMNIDAVEVYNEAWVSLEALQVGRRYETNFNTRTANNQFIYIGDTWLSQEGSRARQYSGLNYDQAREYGAGIVFRTTGGADSMTVYTSLRRGYTTLRICALPVDAGVTTIVDTADEDTLLTDEALCQDFSLDGTGFQQAISFRFHPFAVAGNSDYLVSISTLNDAIFQLDAIELSITGTLAAGYYEGTNVNLYYDNAYEEYVVNGNMETNNTAFVDYWGQIGNVVVAQQSGVRYEGRYGWRVQTTTAGGGIQSLPFDLVDTSATYTAIARVRVLSGTARLRLVQGNSPVSIEEFRVLTQNAGVNNNDWTTIRVDFQLNPLNTYNDMRIQIVANSSNTTFDVDDVHLVRGGVWNGNYNRRLDDGNAWQSQSSGASMFFSFTGTGFELGTIFGRDGGEMEICYDTNAVFGDNSDSCFTYQNEDRRDTTNVARSIVGLPSNTYYVRVRDDENGSTAYGRRLNSSRNSRFSIGKLAVDYVRIFGDNLINSVGAGFYNEDSQNSAGDAYLQLYPSQDWGTVEGRLARNYSGESYSTVLDSRGRAASVEAGQSALLYVDVPEEGATVVLYTGPENRRASTQILVCAGDEMSGAIGQTETQLGLRYILNFVLNSPSTPGDCVLRAANVGTAISVGPDDLAALGSAATDVRVVFTNLVPAQFIIDGYQVIYGNTLTAGVYDSFLPDNLLNFSSSASSEANRDARGCNPDFNWCTVKTRGSIGDSVLSTQDNTASLEFDIEGTGFSVVTNVNLGVRMRICYTQTPVLGEPEFPSLSQVGTVAQVNSNNAETDLTLGGAWCDIFTTNRSAAVWNSPDNGNLGRRLPMSITQYGWAYYGLPYGNYSVEVRMIESVSTLSRNSLDIDAIVVFGANNDLANVIGVGFYDDSEAAISYEPFTSWISSVERFGPPRGPYNLTDTATTSAGSIAQMQVDGNSVTLFQTLDLRNSADVRICVVVTGAVIHCDDDSASTAQGIDNPVSPPPYALAFELANFSQAGRRTYFAPITFYGLGASTPTSPHRIIIENRDNGRELNIDAILVHD